MAALRCILALIALVFSAGLFAQADAPAYDQRAQALPDMLRGSTDIEQIFAPAFLQAVPKTQVEEIARQFVAQYGPVKGVEKITRVSATTGSVEIGYEKAVVRMTMTIEAAAPNRIVGLLVTGVKVRNDGIAALQADINALPGRAGFLIRRLDAPPDQALLSINANHRFAIGSGFKLWVLGALSRAITSGARRWSDVVPLGVASLPSGITQKWPPNAPMTLHSLATLMISISDNSATDTLMRTLGRRPVDAIVGQMGHANPESTLPVLMTAEAFALKADVNAGLRTNFINTPPQARTAWLAREAGKLGANQVNRTVLLNAPLYIDQIEWFASPQDMVRTLDWLRRMGGQEALSILSINPGLAEGDAARFAYVGYKGGSETGVISMNLLIRTKRGLWYAVTGSWNNPLVPVDEQRFIGLVARAAALLPD